MVRISDDILKYSIYTNGFIQIILMSFMLYNTNLVNMLTLGTINDKFDNS